MSLPKARRVVRSAEFKSTYQSGTRISSRLFVVFCRRAELPATVTRFGFTCPRSLGNAVVRNCIKRRLREAVRAGFGQTPDGWVVVFNPRRAALDVSFGDLRTEVQRVLSKCSASSSVS